MINIFIKQIKFLKYLDWVVEIKVKIKILKKLIKM